MKTRPMLLRLLFAYLTAVAISMPVQIMWLYGHPPYEWIEIAAKLTPLNWLICAMAPITGCLIYQASPLALAAVPALAYVIIANNWFAAELATDYSPLWAGVGTGLFLLSLTPLLKPATLRLFLHPEKRWWRTPHRRRASLPVVFQNEGLEFIVNTFDISEGGAFIPAWPVRPREPRTYLTSLVPGKVITVFLDLKNAARIGCRAQIVRQSDATGDYPSGIAIRFLDMSWRERRLIAQYADQRNAG